MSNIDHKELVKAALAAREKAYAPYSGFRVGAAVLTKNHRVFTGVNIENASYGATNCAERTAIFKAVSEGETEIEVMAIASDSKNPTFPCGICRQVIAEFGNQSTVILCSDQLGEYKTFTLGALLPEAFTKEDLKTMHDKI